MKAVLYGALIGGLGGLIGLGGGEFRLPVLTRIFGYNVKLAVPINLAVNLLTVVSATITRISITSVEGLVPIYSMYSFWPWPRWSVRTWAPHTCIACMKQVSKEWSPACFS